MDTPAQGGQVPLKIPPEDVGLLRGWFAACADGRRADAEKEPDSDANPRRLEEAEAFDQLGAALSTYTLTPTKAIREALCGLATAVDATNDYATAVREHDAAHGLLDQIKAAL